MTRRQVVFCLAPAAALLAAGPTDDELYDQVRRRLASDPNVKGGALDVTVSNGVVTLRGEVESDKQKLQAEKTAKKVKGVKQVVNELKVSR
jgi:osmotically-inducible protein OsmY